MALGAVICFCAMCRFGQVLVRVGFPRARHKGSLRMAQWGPGLEVPECPRLCSLAALAFVEETVGSPSRV